MGPIEGAHVAYSGLWLDRRPGAGAVSAPVFMTNRIAARAAVLSSVAVRLSLRLSLLVLLLGILPGGFAV
jgi:hypothetical protein